MGDGERWRAGIASAAHVSRREVAAAVERLARPGRDWLERNCRQVGVAETLVEVANMCMSTSCCSRASSGISSRR